jgi:diacylglycerol O-acyltransferase / wax synthase
MSTSATRLSALDASFLAAETATAHMHVGWAAVFDPPDDRPPPGFGELRDHVAARLGRAPRYRQRLAPVPFGVHDPLWVDDEAFDIDHHVLLAGASDLRGVVDLAMSSQLERSRPLWELWIADQLDDGRIGVVGKAHHCMVDGLAAVELASLLLDPERDPEPVTAQDWQPEPAPGRMSLLASGAVERVRGELYVLRLPARLLASPRRRLGGLVGDTRRTALALGHSLGTPAPMSLFNKPSSPLRHLGTVGRTLEDLRRIKTRYGTTINDVVLAVSAGGVRRFLQQHGEPTIRLKAMVPVSVRATGAASELGNRISFIFIELPCDQPDPVHRLLTISRVTSERKQTGEPQGADTVLKLAAHSPHWVQHAITRLIASPRTFNLVVSNIPGPQQPLYMRGCRLAEAYPIVPLAERHAVSIGVTTIAGRAYFGLYADRKSLPDVDLLANDVDDAIDELLPHPDGHRPRAGVRARPLHVAPP